MAETTLADRAPAKGVGAKRRGVSVTWIRLFTLAAVLAAWELLARSGLLYEDVVPPLEKVAVAFVHLILSAETYRHLGVTAWEVLTGFAIGFAAGVGLGVQPYVDGFATAPKIIFLPIVMLAFGTGIGSKVALAALSAFFPVAINTAAGVRQIDPVFVRVGRSFRLTPLQMMFRIYLPAMRRSLVTSMRLGFGLAVIGCLLSEIKLSNAGLGHLAIEHYNNFRVPDLYAVLILVFVLAVGANTLMARLMPRH